MTLAPQVYEWHGLPRHVRYGISVVCLVACVVAGFYAHAQSSGAVVISAVFGFAALAIQLDQRIHIDPERRTVLRQFSIFGRRLWASARSLDDFASIGIYRLPAGTPQAPSDLVHVGLRGFGGGILAVRYFQAGRAKPCEEADNFAQTLHETTGLKLDEVSGR